MKVSKIIDRGRFKAGLFEALKFGYKPDKAGVFAIGYACSALHVRCDTPATKLYPAAVAYALLLIEEAQE